MLALKGSDFVQHAPAHPCADTPSEPVVPDCSDCELPANPSWGDVDGKAYCRRCVPPSLRKPSQYLRNSEENHGA